MNRVRIGVIGDFDPTSPTHRATNEGIRHSATKLGAEVDVSWLPTDALEGWGESSLENFDGFFCAPGSPESLEGALIAIRFARESDRPFIGTCGGFQNAILEYARNVLGFEDAAHAEYEPRASKLFITPLSCSLAGKTMKVRVRRGSGSYLIYGEEYVEEKHYCSFGLNPDLEKTIFSGGMNASGSGEDGEVRIIELESHRFFLATLFVPQASSTAENPHPLVAGFVDAAREFVKERNDFEKTIVEA